MYEKIDLNEIVEVMLPDGTTIMGEVVSKDSEWLSVLPSFAKTPWSIARQSIVAFRFVI